MSATATNIEAVATAQAGERLGFGEPLQLSPASAGRPLTRWKMAEDDQPIFRWLYRHHRPLRHLEFGTWRGDGTCYVLEESDAAVWTINLLEGERKPDGGFAYCEAGVGDVPPWAHGRTLRDGRIEHQTDAFGFIGSEYRRRGLAHRVYQVYCNSLEWDPRSIPPGFFDSVLIDGGHTPEVVASDTRKALPLVRPGGLVLWHDYCLDDEAVDKCSSVQGVVEAVHAMHDELRLHMRDLFWINPSWILVGVKA
jgi:predicted O-methyltransferase YrrM